MQPIPEDAVPEDSGDEDEEDPDKRISSECFGAVEIACFLGSCIGGCTLWVVRAGEMCNL